MWVVRVFDACKNVCSGNSSSVSRKQVSRTTAIFSYSSTFVKIDVGFLGTNYFIAWLTMYIYGDLIGLCSRGTVKRSFNPEVMGSDLLYLIYCWFSLKNAISTGRINHKA